MRCGCGPQDCETRIYVDDVMVSGVHVIFNHKSQSGELVPLKSAEQLEIPASDAALKQLVKDVLFVLRQ